jgi:hypothetical protein
MGQLSCHHKTQFMSMQKKIYTYTNTHEAVRLVALEVSSALLHNGVFNSRSNHLNCGNVEVGN